MRVALGVLLFAIGAVAAVMIIAIAQSFKLARIDGNAMAPRYQSGDHVLISKLSYDLVEPKREQVVAFFYPLNPAKSFVQRVIAVAGDTVRIVAGRVYVNDSVMRDEYVAPEFRSHDNWGPQVVPQGYFFVMGDHRNNCSDSRHWGFVPLKYIWGHIVTTVWHAR